MKTFRLIGMALLAVVMCVNFTSCSNDDEEESNGGKSTQELLQGVWYDAYTDGYPYFIVEKGYCYFSNQPSTVYYGEKYKYTFDSKNNMLMCWMRKDRKSLVKTGRLFMPTARKPVAVTAQPTRFMTCKKVLSGRR